RCGSNACGAYPCGIAADHSAASDGGAGHRMDQAPLEPDPEPDPEPGIRGLRPLPSPEDQFHSGSGSGSGPGSGGGSRTGAKGVLTDAMPELRRRGVREALTVRLDVSGMMREAIGPEGLARGEVDALAERAAQAARALQTRRTAGEVPVFDLPQQGDMVKEIGALARQVREEGDTLVVLGIGGSALGSRAILQALADGTKRVEVADNVDPWSFGQLLDALDLTRTAFNVVSKSGETAATMAQFLIVRDRLLRALGAIDYQPRVIVTTDAEHGSLRQIVNDEGFRALAVPDGVSGRFSVLTAAGLFPAAVGGVRIEDLLAGAAWMDSRLRSEQLWENPAHLLGAL